MSDTEVTITTPETIPVSTSSDNPQIGDMLTRITTLENTITELRIEKERMDKWDEVSEVYKSQDFNALYTRMDALEQKIAELEITQIIDEENEQEENEQEETQDTDDDTAVIENAPIKEIPPIIPKSRDYFTNRRKGV